LGNIGKYGGNTGQAWGNSGNIGKRECEQKEFKGVRGIESVVMEIELQTSRQAGRQAGRQ
jgi:hypothetical protein